MGLLVAEFGEGSRDAVGDGVGRAEGGRLRSDGDSSLDRRSGRGERCGPAASQRSMCGVGLTELTENRSIDGRPTSVSFERGQLQPAFQRGAGGFTVLSASTPPGRCAPGLQRLDESSCDSGGIDRPVGRCLNRPDLDARLAVGLGSFIGKTVVGTPGCQDRHDDEHPSPSAVVSAGLYPPVVLSRAMTHRAGDCPTDPDASQAS